MQISTTITYILEIFFVCYRIILWFITRFNYLHIWG